MIDWSEKLGPLISHPMTTTVTGVSVATGGALTRLAETLPVIHELLADGAIMLGCLATIIGIIAQLQRVQLNIMERKIKKSRYRRRISDI